MLHNEFLFVLFFSASLVFLSILFIIDSIKDAVKDGRIGFGFWMGALFALMATVYLCHYSYPGGTLYQHPQDVISGIIQRNPDLIKQVDSVGCTEKYIISDGVKIASGVKKAICIDASECQKITKRVEYLCDGIVIVLLILTIVHAVIQIKRRKNEFLCELKYQGCRIDDLNEKLDRHLARIDKSRKLRRDNQSVTNNK